MATMIMVGGSQTIGPCSLHFLMSKWFTSVITSLSQWQGYPTPVSHLTFGLRQLWIWTQSSNKGGCSFCRLRSNCLQQQEMLTTLQGWKPLCNRTPNASVVIGSMWSVNQRGWRRMSKQFRTSRQPRKILMLIPLTSLQQWGHCSLVWSPHKDLCMTSRLHLQMAKFRLKLCFKRECSPRPNLSLQLSTKN